MSKFIQIISRIIAGNKKAIAVLIDPDQPDELVLKIVQNCSLHHVDFIFVGGSLITNGNIQKTIQIIKQNYSGPVYIFPGNELMTSDSADGILLLSLLSGRNSEYLIGKHVVAAPALAKSNLDIVPTAYLLIDGGKETSVSYISNTKPIPSDKADIAAATALAGKLLGMQLVYLDAGSGALHSVPIELINKVKKTTQIPLVVGGGIRNPETALQMMKAGADLLVIGNGTEENQNLIAQIAQIRNSIRETVEI